MMNAETEIVTKVFDIQGEIDRLFIGFAFLLEELPEIAKVHQSCGWHNPNFRNSAPTFHACLTAWKDEETGFSWAIVMRLKEEKWMITRQVRKQHRSGHSDTTVEFPILEADSLDELKLKVLNAANELIKSAHSVGFHIPESGLMPGFYEALNHVPREPKQHEA